MPPECQAIFHDLDGNGFRGRDREQRDGLGPRHLQDAQNEPPDTLRVPGGCGPVHQSGGVFRLG